MGQVKAALLEYKDMQDELNEFKIAVENRFDFFRELISQEVEMLKFHRADYAAKDVEETYNEFPPELAVEIFSELGCSKSIIPMKDVFSEEASEPYYYYEFNEMWKYFKELNPFDFLICMVVIASSNSEWQSISKLQRFIVKEFASYGFKIKYNKSSAFIAMSFGEKMQKVRQTIIDVVEEFGYKAILIDIKEHNNQIVPEIFYEIENSTFVIGDLTEHKTGVYLEVGYALAKNKQVILSCKSDDFNDRHFDVNQINTISWKDEKDLESRLRKRLTTMHLDFI